MVNARDLFGFFGAELTLPHDDRAPNVHLKGDLAKKYSPPPL
jgi:hypothetical protein